ncbi:MAG: exopolysaccharide biosynthesis protein [Anaerolineaceae bacterium]|nr:exopolysaccharide biosynthesis protein [Anaerolineaceae bacterium]
MTKIKNVENIEEQQSLKEESLGEKIEKVINEMTSSEVTLMEIMGIIGNDSLMFLTIFLSLVFLVPVSIPGVSTVFGSAILLIGISRLFNRNLWLPKKIVNRTISTEKLIIGLKKALKWFHRFEKFSRPRRLAWLSEEGKIGLINRLSFILSALLLMFPFGFIPFSNTLPAIALIFLAIGFVQRDGVSTLIGQVANVATIIYFGVLIAGGGMTVLEIGSRLLD